MDNFIFKDVGAGPTFASRLKETADKVAAKHDAVEDYWAGKINGIYQFLARAAEAGQYHATLHLSRDFLNPPTTSMLNEYGCLIALLQRNGFQTTLRWNDKEYDLFLAGEEGHLDFQTLDVSWGEEPDNHRREAIVEGIVEHVIKKAEKLAGLTPDPTEDIIFLEVKHD